MDWKDGFLMGLRASQYMSVRQIQDEIERLEGSSVDGTAEWQSWNIDADMGVVMLARLRRTGMPDERTRPSSP
jgi:hypothetical protein